MAHRIVEADPAGVGYAHGLRAGDMILTIGGEKVIDEIDYQALTAERVMDILGGCSCTERLAISRAVISSPLWAT